MRKRRLPEDVERNSTLRSNMLGPTPEWVFEGNQSLVEDGNFRSFVGLNKYSEEKDSCLKIVEPTKSSDAKRDDATLPSMCRMYLCSQFLPNGSMRFFGAFRPISFSICASHAHSKGESFGESQ